MAPNTSQCKIATAQDDPASGYRPSRAKSNFTTLRPCLHVGDARVFVRSRVTRPSAGNAFHYGFVDGRWADAGTFESLQDANAILMANENRIPQ
jgi:hypothetical protein